MDEKIFNGKIYGAKVILSGFKTPNRVEFFSVFDILRLPSRTFWVHNKMHKLLSFGGVRR